MRKLILALMVVTVLLVTTSLAIAQDEQELLDRVLAAADEVENYESYVGEVIREMNVNVAIPSIAMEIVQTQSLTGSGTFILGDSPNGVATLTATEADSQEGTSSTIEAEIRYVDGVLYVNAAYTEGGETAALPLAEGWVVVDDLANFPELEALSLDEMPGVELAGEEDTEDEGDEGQSPAEVLADIADSAVSMTASEDEVDGEAVDVITLGYTTEGFLEFLDLAGEGSLSENPETAAMFGAFPADTEVMSMAVAIDEDDQIRGIAIIFDLTMEDFDMGDMDASMTGIVVNFSVNGVFGQTYSQIGEEFEPAEAPEV